MKKILFIWIKTRLLPNVFFVLFAKKIYIYVYKAAEQNVYKFMQLSGNIYRKWVQKTRIQAASYIFFILDLPIWHV